MLIRLYVPQQNITYKTRNSNFKFPTIHTNKHILQFILKKTAIFIFANFCTCLSVNLYHFILKKTFTATKKKRNELHANAFLTSIIYI